jgi:hypothetical protein
MDIYCALNQSISSNYSTLNTKKPDIALYDYNSYGFVDISSSNGRFIFRIWKTQKVIEFYYRDATTGEGWDYKWAGTLS